MAVDIQKLFNEQLPAAIDSNPDAAKAIGNKFQINISGDNGGKWFIDCTDDGPKAEAGEGEADCTINVADEHFQKLVENPAGGMQLFMEGKIKVTGNPMLAMKLQKLFDLAK